MRRYQFSYAAVVLVAAVVLEACSEGTGSAASGSLSASLAPSQASSPELRELSALGEDRLAPGRYAFTAFGADDGTPVPLMKVPSGFSAYRGFSVAGSGGPGFRAVMAWTVDTVYLRPCTMSGGFRPGPSPRDLVEALARQRGTTTTRAEPVRLGGQKGLYVEVTGPAGLTECPVAFTLWANDGGGRRYLQAPGQVDRLWILDTPGERLVVDLTHTPIVGAGEVGELTEIVRSTRFVAP
jgi:hypothetical protein